MVLVRGRGRRREYHTFSEGCLVPYKMVREPAVVGASKDTLVLEKVAVRPWFSASGARPNRISASSWSAKMYASRYIVVDGRRSWPVAVGHNIRAL